MLQAVNFTGYRLIWRTLKKRYFIHNKENNIRNIFGTLMFQQLLANKHHRLRDSVPITIWPSGGLRLVTDIKKKNNKNNKSRAKQEPRSAHGRAVKKVEPFKPNWLVAPGA